MADYKQDTISGTKWQRCNRVQIINDLNDTPRIIFGEEEIISLNGEFIHNQPKQYECASNFSYNTSINLRDPNTGELTGATSTQGELYVLLYSLYIQTALERDEAVT